MDWLRRLFTLPIRLYRRFVSPLTPPSCRFRPTCSAYGERAILVHGILKGSLLTVWRILRCQPFSDGGFDPVPPRGAWRAARQAAPGAGDRTPASGERTAAHDAGEAAGRDDPGAA